MGKISLIFLANGVEKGAYYETLEEALWDAKAMSEVPGHIPVKIINGPIQIKGWELQNMLRKVA